MEKEYCKCKDLIGHQATETGFGKNGEIICKECNKPVEEI